MIVDVFTLFPRMFDGFLSTSIVKRAIDKGLVEVRAHDLRRWTHDRHKTCDDRPFGGGPGMLMTPGPIFEAADEVLGGRRFRRSKSHRYVYLTPQGRSFDQAKARELASCKRVALLCGHYEGVDQRVIDELVTDEVSIGDYVLTGGELAAMVVVDAAVRLVPGVLGCEESKTFETFDRNLLEYPQYTRPAVYRGIEVPSVLLSGNHRQIELWRNEQSLKRTAERRPDLYQKHAAHQAPKEKPRGARKPVRSKRRKGNA